MLDDENTPETGTSQEAPAESGAAEPAAAPAKKTAKRTAAKKTAKKAPAKKATTRRTTKKAATADQPPADQEATAEPSATEPPADASAAAAAAADDEPGANLREEAGAAEAPAKKTAKRAPRKAAAKRTSKKAAAAKDETPAESPAGEPLQAEQLGDVPAAEAPPAQAAGQAAAAASSAESADAPGPATPPAATALLFQPPDPSKAVTPPRRRRATKAETEDTAEAEETPAEKPSRSRAKKSDKPAEKAAPQPAEGDADETRVDGAEDRERAEGEDATGGGRRRRRGGRRRRRGGGGDGDGGAADGEDSPDRKDDAKPAAKDEGKAGGKDEPKGAGKEDKQDSGDAEDASSGSRRRRRRRRSGDSADVSADDPEATVTKVRKPRSAEDEITALTGSTRLEAKKQRRREGREAGRRRAPIVSEAEFLARRESVDRVMVIRQRGDLTQIAVLEDDVLVEHYVSRESQTSLIGNVYLGRVQNVLPSMEAAFIDIGKGRNAVLYAGEVNWEALGHKNGSPRKIESVLKSGQSILVQVTKDPAGHKGARLTSQISLPGRFLVYVPDGTTSGISRKLPDTERNRLKNLLKEIVPESAGVIVRTAAEGASEDELTRDVERLTARWEDIEKKAKSGNAPQLLYGEPDLTLKVVRDLFTEDFNKLVVAGDDAWDMVEAYVDHVAPDLAERLEKYDGERDVFAEYRIDEQIQKALDRKVWLPSGGSLVIDRTEAMTVVDVNTGKFTGSGGNLEETVTKNNLEAAEEIVRQLRLRDIGGIIVVDFIDMVLESNRDLVLRRLVECLGRDRTRHQVAEVTSLGLVQMTRKRIGTGLLEAFSEPCEHCNGRGLILHHEPVEPKKKGEDDQRRGRRGRGRGRDEGQAASASVPSPKEFAAMAKSDEKEREASQTPADASGDASESPKGRERGKEPDGVPAGPADQGTPRAAEQDAAATDDGAAAPETGATKAPKVSTRKATARKSRTSRKAAAPHAASTEAVPAGAGPAETAPTEPAASEGTPAGTATAADGDVTGPSGNTEPEQPQPPAEPVVTVTTRTRRRRAVRPVGQAEPVEAPSAVATEPAGVAAGASQPDGGSATEPSATEPSATERESQPESAPKIVTSVRRRSARRAAGPPPAEAASSPSGGASVALLDAAEPGSSEPSENGDPDETTTPHVPVKKKGARRR